MKWILLLAAAVLLLVGAWLLLGTDSGSTTGKAASILEMPRSDGGKAELIKAAQQFLKINPRAMSVREGCALLRAVTEGLSDEEWPQVQAAAFRGFNGLHLIPGSREHLEPVLEKLLDRFVRFGSVGDLEVLILKSNEKHYFKDRIEQSLLRAASKEVTPADGQENRLRLILEASVRSKDYERAGTYVFKARWAEGVPEKLQTPVLRLQGALRHRFTAAEGKADFSQAIREWIKAPEDPLSGPVYVDSGYLVAQAGQGKLDFSAIREAMQSTKGEAGGEKYWAQVIDRCMESRTKSRPFGEVRAVEALINSYSNCFQAGAYESGFWKKLAEENTSTEVQEAMWRAYCLKNAAIAATTDEARLPLIRAMVKDCLIYGSPQVARKFFDLTAGRVETPSGLDSVREDLRRGEVAQQTAQQKLERDTEEQSLRLELQERKLRIAQARRENAAPELIQDLERRVKELEKKLPE